ncbi:unnamed protein product [Moneuplotes crassus]|uniref:RNA helicase n=1 Tax=Euplotes crassus TaxID=5936 RepID=A0AAD1X5M6_EUPCR|nr:unnamed protein product [Moneuplotes crassus]
MTRAGFTKPTAIQSKGWPIIQSGNDLVGIADTGSGKTLCYLLPGIVHIMAQDLVQPGDSPIMLVIVPTRELCTQVEKECRRFASVCKVSTMCVYGGVSRTEQLQTYQRGVDIMVATPGRLLDFLTTKEMNLSRITYLVLDEADKMLDMGFEKDLKQISTQIRPDRQTLLFSATWPIGVQQLAKKYCYETPKEIKIGSNDLTVNDRITQNIYVIQESEKLSKLVDILCKIAPGSKTIIFCGTKQGCQDLSSALGKYNCSNIVMHGDIPQDERESIVRQFKGQFVNILIATDLVSRGIHIPDVNYVINYDFPTKIETYVHRIGRTGRAGATGVSHTLFTTKSIAFAPELGDIMTRAKQKINPEFQELIDQANNNKSDNILAKLREGLQSKVSQIEEEKKEGSEAKNGTKKSINPEVASLKDAERIQSEIVKKEQASPKMSLNQVSSMLAVKPKMIFKASPKSETKTQSKAHKPALPGLPMLHCPAPKLHKIPTVALNMQTKSQSKAKWGKK